MLPEARETKGQSSLAEANLTDAASSFHAVAGGRICSALAPLIGTHPDHSVDSPMLGEKAAEALRRLPLHEAYSRVQSCIASMDVVLTAAFAAKVDWENSCTRYEDVLNRIRIYLSPECKIPFLPLRELDCYRLPGVISPETANELIGTILRAFGYSRRTLLGSRKGEDELVSFKASYVPPDVRALAIAGPIETEYQAEWVSPVLARLRTSLKEHLALQTIAYRDAASTSESELLDYLRNIYEGVEDHEGKVTFGRGVPGLLTTVFNLKSERSRLARRWAEFKTTALRLEEHVGSIKERMHDELGRLLIADPVGAFSAGIPASLLADAVCHSGEQAKEQVIISLMSHIRTIPSYNVFARKRLGSYVATILSTSLQKEGEMRSPNESVGGTQAVMPAPVVAKEAIRKENAA